MLGLFFILYWRFIFESVRLVKVKNLWEIKWKLCINFVFLVLKINLRLKEKNADMLNDFYEIYVSEKDGRF